MPEGHSKSLIEQLHYTWAPRGAEGINQFQIAGISAGLKRAPLVSLLPDLRRLCRYDRPAGSEDGPPSFGWLDLGRHRVAFLRVPVPGVDGRSGSFAAHLLVGDRASLPEAELASSFGAGFWWQGLSGEELANIADGKQDFTLPPLDWAKALSTKVEPGVEMTDAAGALVRDLLSLEAGKQLAVLDGRSAFGPALRYVGSKFPNAVAGISVSTYEDALMFPFTLVGMIEPRPGMPTGEIDGELDSESRSTARQLLGHHPESALLRAAVAHISIPDHTRGTKSRWATATTLVGLGEAGDMDAHLVAESADPYVIGYLAHTDNGRERIAESVTRGLSRPLAALARASEFIAPTNMARLGEAIQRQYAACADLNGCAAVLATLPPSQARDRVEEQVLQVALRPESVAMAPGAQDCLALVRIASARNLTIDHCGPLLALAARHIGACAGNPAIPPSMLIAMLPLALDGRADEMELCRALHNRPHLLIEAAPEADELGRWLGFGSHLRARQLDEALPALLAGLGRASQPELSALLGRSPGSAGRRALLSAVSLFGRNVVPPTLTRLCEASGTQAVEEGEVEIARRLLSHGTSSDSQIGAELLAASQSRAADQLRAAYAVGQIHDSALRGVIFEVAVDAALRRLRHVGDADRVWALLVSSYPGSEVGTLLEWMLARATAAPPGSGQAVLLVWLVTTLLPANPDLCKHNFQLRDQTSAKLVDTLALRMSSLEIERMTRLTEGAGRRTARWWKSVVKQQRRGDRGRR